MKDSFHFYLMTWLCSACSEFQSNPTLGCRTFVENGEIW